VRLGVFTVPYGNLPLAAALDKLAGMGVEAVELGTGNYPGAAHCDPDVLLDDAGARRELRSAVESRGMIISALSQHGNPLHPDAAVAAAAHETWRKTVRLAAVLEVPVVNAFSGCPGSSATSTRPNWVTCWWPPEFAETLEWQWAERVVPYWQAEGAFAQAEGVQIGFEMHPGFVVYNPESLLRLRDAVGPVIGANFDPSHLVWQGIDPVEAIKAVAAADAMFHFHAKDTYIDGANVARNGVLDTKPYSRFLDRSWSFRTVGYGQPEKTWRDIMSALRTTGYDYVVSIEHEDGLLGIDEGMTKAIGFLNTILFKDRQMEEMWWVDG
jgi:sugar phosphate isomerase/epimerase